MRGRLGEAATLLPGILLCAAIALAGRLLEAAERGLLGNAWLDALVLAILIGAGLRTMWQPAERFRPGIRFAGTRMLEIGVVLLGASLDLRAAAAGGPGLPLMVAGVVGLALGAGYGIGRVFGLPHRAAMLIACGNAICGNSAIAAVAPVLGASARDVAAAIAVTALLGILAVLALPPLGAAFGLDAARYGAFAGLTVYAVPQVMAATAPFGSTAMQAGMLVKLLRVLMLGPVVLALSAVERRRQVSRGQPDAPGAATAGTRATRFLPWFILGFLALVAANALGLVPAAMRAPAQQAAHQMTALALAALGLGVELRGLLRAGPSTAAAAAAALLLLGGVSLGAALWLAPAG